MKNAIAYERPELMELGKAEELTLGVDGNLQDGCGCCYPSQPGLGTIRH